MTAEDEAREDAWETAPHLRRWRSEGNPALWPLFERFRPQVQIEIRRVFGGKLPPGYELDDLVHEVFAAICAAEPESLDLERKGAFRAVLMRVTHNKMIDILRRAQAARRNQGREPAALDTRARDLGRPPEAAPAEPATPSQAASAHEQVDLMRQHLGEQAFAVWHAREVEGLRTQEVAERLGCSERQVRRLYKEAMVVRGRLMGDAGP